MIDNKIDIKNIYKIFGDKRKKAIDLLEKGETKENILVKTKQVVGLNNVSLSIKEGEVFVIMGLSGSGKSTLVRCINRLIEPTKGDIFIDGINITDANPVELRGIRRKKIGMVFQNFGLFPHLSILDNVAYGLKIQDVEKEERYKKAKNTIEKVGLNGWENSYPDQLSGGMQQRVGLARALANDPDILLMDEAFSALDPLIRSDMQDELLELQSNMNKTIVFITHDLDEALKIGDRIGIMKDGEVVQIGTPEEILISPANEYVERFVQDVDRTKFLTVSKVMQKPITIAKTSESIDKALQKMNKHKFDNIFLIEDDNKLLGLIRKGRLKKSINSEEKNIQEFSEHDFHKVDKDTSMEELFPLLASSKEPIAVISKDNKLQGIITRKHVIKVIAERGHEN